MKSGDYSGVSFVNLQHRRARILWRVDGTSLTPEIFKYVPYETDVELPWDMQGLEPVEMPAMVFCNPSQHGTRKLLQRNQQ